MKKYLEQLLEELNKATQKLSPPHEIWQASGADPDDEIELEDMSFVEEFMYGVKKPIGQITGILPEQLPTAEALTHDQQAMLSVKLEEFLDFFNFKLEFPQDFPNHQRYVFIRKFWESERVPVSFGTTHIEFCDYDEENCPFPGYCKTCSEFNQEPESEKNFETDNNFEAFDLSPSQIFPTREEIELFFESQKISEDLGGTESGKAPFYCGIYNDDGTPINPKDVPLPDLCLRCKSYFAGDAEENILCLLNRNDQKDDPDFKCGAFEEF